MCIERERKLAHLRIELAYWLERWERGCRWFAAAPGREASNQAVALLGEVADGWCEAMGELEALAPDDAALVEAQARLDAIARLTEVSHGLRAG